MATLREQILAETTIRALLDEYELPQPDRVEYDHTCIRLFFLDTKTVVVVDFDELTEPSQTSPADSTMPAEPVGSTEPAGSADREEHAP
jgi:hypothetical protein